MDRHARTTFWALGLCLAVGCSGLGENRVRKAAAPEAHNMLTEGPNLLPAMPVSSTGATRGQMPEAPAPANPVKQTSAVVGQNNPQVAVRIRAHVNGLPILDDEVREALIMKIGELAKLPESERAAKFKQVMDREINNLVERELILQDAFTKIKEIKKPQLMEELKREAGKEADKRLKEIKTATKMKTDDEFRTFMQQQGLSVDGMRRQTERNFMMTEYIRNLIYPSVKAISLQQVREYYDEHPELFEIEDRVKWMDLFVDASRFLDMNAARQHAQTLAERAKAGEDFASLVKQYDNGDSSLRNGVGIGQKRGEIQPAIAEATIFALKPGEVGPLVDMGFGFHVIKVVEREIAGREPFDEKCQAKVRDRLRNQIADREYKRIVGELKRTATIVIYPD